ncbi:hypothetical protein IFR05_010665 [Cadophora sp. M221]|nr:hypothetical protein IFR05_010665 [Cadophora sp. M221]
MDVQYFYVDDRPWLTRAPKGSTYAEVAALALKDEQTRKKQNKCYLLMLPTGRLPSNEYKNPERTYGNLWEDVYYGLRGGGRCFISTSTRNYTMFTSFDDFRQDLIRARKDIPDTVQNGTTTIHTLFKKKEMPVMILNESDGRANSFTQFGYGVRDLMVTCKQVGLEVAEVLYGENVFLFDTRREGKAFPRPAGHDLTDFKASDIPGLTREAGMDQTEHQISLAIQYIFDKSRLQPKYVQEYPFMLFFNKISPTNAAHLNKIIIKGYFKVPELANIKEPIGLARILPIYATILSRVCPNLRALTLHMGTDTRPRSMCGERYRYEHQLDGELDELERFDRIDNSITQTDDEMIDDAVKHLIQSLPSLAELKLGNYKSTSISRGDMRWGKSVRWIEMVEARALQSHTPVPDKSKAI